MRLKERIRAEAGKLGFSRIGFAAAGERGESRLLQEWLDRGFAGGMNWLHRRRRERADPTVLAPWVRSLVLASLPYEGSPEDLPPGSARIARYARTRDYHTVFRDRLGKLGQVLQDAAPGTRVRPVVDTGAILEKPWAAAAGLGWQGKHTNLIHPDSGSWFFLGELLTDAVIEPDGAAVTDRCGSCALCLEACPTGAFPEPYVLDSRRCISYLTIEERGPIPENLRPLMEDRVFGCDICQEVCPWNRQPDPADGELEGSGEVPRLLDLMRMSREDFRRRFAGTAIRRTGWSRFLRNVAVALGNSADPRAAPVLEEALGIPDPLIREHVAWALDRLRQGASVPTGETAGPRTPAREERP